MRLTNKILNPSGKLSRIEYLLAVLVLVILGILPKGLIQFSAMINPYLVENHFIIFLVILGKIVPKACEYILFICLLKRLKDTSLSHTMIGLIVIMTLIYQVYSFEICKYITESLGYEFSAPNIILLYSLVGWVVIKILPGLIPSGSEKVLTGALS